MSVRKDSWQRTSTATGSWIGGGHRQTADSIAVLMGNGDGGFTDPRIFPVVGVEPIPIAALDFDRDGMLDLATGDYANGATGGLSFFKGSGDGLFEPPSECPWGME